MKTKLVGIVNVTPDSFSDGGDYLDAKAAVDKVFQLTSDGADVVDIGAESTRPGATPMSPEEEWARLAPVMEALMNRRSPVAVSVDTRHAATAKKALEYGAEWINDVSGFSDPAMIEAVRSSTSRLVVMHSLTLPADPSVTLPKSADVIEALVHFAASRIGLLEKSGIAHRRILFDPGLGFGKTKEQSLAILRGIEKFRALGVPLLIGHSRKSFLAKPGDTPALRDEATLTVSRRLCEAGIDYLRVHNIAAHRAMMAVETVRG